MRRKKLLAPLLAALIIIQLACGALGILITACDGAPAVIVTLPIKPETREKWNTGFTNQARIFRVLEASPKSKADKAKCAIDTIENLRHFVMSGHGNSDLWITAIITMVKGFLHIPPDVVAPDGTMSMPTDLGDFTITKKQAEELKRKIDKGPDKE